MQQYSWPGNIRELQNVIERCVILADGEVLRVEPGMLMQELAFGSDSDKRRPSSDRIEKLKSKPCCARRVARFTDHAALLLDLDCRRRRSIRKSAR